jgi:hypothetical protein
MSPFLSITHTRCLTDPQSIPAKYSNSLSNSISPFCCTSTFRVEHLPLYWRSCSGAYSLLDLLHGPLCQSAAPFEALHSVRGHPGASGRRSSLYLLLLGRVPQTYRGTHTHGCGKLGSVVGEIGGCKKKAIGNCFGYKNPRKPKITIHRIRLSAISYHLWQLQRVNTSAGICLKSQIIPKKLSFLFSVSF